MSLTMEPGQLYSAWMWYKSADNNKWSAVYASLRDSTLFFFSSDQTSLENHIGTLKLTKECSVHNGRDGNPAQGYKFELHIDKKKKRKFRVKTVYERELWRAHLHGIITGQMPQDVILSPQDIQDITRKLQQVHLQPLSPGGATYIQPAANSPGQSKYPPYPDPSVHSPSQHPPLHRSAGNTSFQSMTTDVADRISQCSVGEARGSRRPSLPSIRTTSIRSGDSGSSSSSGGEFDPPAGGFLSSNRFSHVSHSSSSVSKDSGRLSDSSDGGGPFMNHRFDASESGKIPSWFFNECSRELAEKILTQCSSYGNTMMRVSITARNTGSYAISKRLERSEGRKTGQVQHYEVIRVAEGYRINVDNPHSAMKTLSEVMRYFIELSGPSTTFLMTSNDLQQLGIDYTEYTRRISSLPKDTTTPATSSQEELVGVDQNDNSAYYEVPSNPAPIPQIAAAKSQIPQGGIPTFPGLMAGAVPSDRVSAFNTWRNDKAEKNSFNQRASSGVLQAQAKTIGPSDWRHNTGGSKPTIQQKFQEQSAIGELDDVINKEEQRQVTKDKISSDPDKPPPLPVVPKNRPKLDEHGHPISTSFEAGNGESELADVANSMNYQNLRQSVPVIQVPQPPFNLNSIVQANVPPPSVVSPLAAAAIVKTAPPTAPKSNQPIPTPTVPADRSERPVSGPGLVVMNELASKLQKRRLASEQSETPSDSSSYSNTPLQLSTFASETQPSAPQPYQEGQLYEQLDNNLYQNYSQEYQNCDSRS